MMPRIPESAVTVGLPGVSAQPIREALEIGQSVVGFTEASKQLFSQLAEAERAEELMRMSASLEGSLADLQLEIQQDPEFNTVASANQAWMEGSEQIREELGQSNSETVNLAINKQFLQSNLRGSISVRKVAYGRQVDAAIANLDSDTEDFERKYAVATSDDERAEIRETFARNVKLSSFISEQEKGNRIRAYNNDTDTARVRGLIDSGQFEAAEELLNSEQLVGLDPQQSLALVRTLETAKNRAERDLAADLKKVEVEKRSKMLRRFYDPDDPNGVPTVLEVLDAEFASRIETEHFIEMVEKHAAGADLNVISPRIYNELYIRIHDEDHEEHITDSAELLPFVGNGISPEKAELLRKDIEEIAVDPVTNRIRKDFLKMAKTAIAPSGGLFSGDDPVGEQMYFDFLDAEQMVYENHIKEGGDPRDLYRPSHEAYVGKIIKDYERTVMERMDDMADQLDFGTSPVPKSPDKPIDEFMRDTLGAR
jgi:hypothetical protein